MHQWLVDALTISRSYRISHRSCTRENDKWRLFQNYSGVPSNFLIIFSELWSIPTLLLSELSETSKKPITFCEHFQNNLNLQPFSFQGFLRIRETFKIFWAFFSNSAFENNSNLFTFTILYIIFDSFRPDPQHFLKLHKRFRRIGIRQPPYIFYFSAFQCSSL